MEIFVKKHVSLRLKVQKLIQESINKINWLSSLPAKYRDEIITSFLDNNLDVKKNHSYKIVVDLLGKSGLSDQQLSDISQLVETDLKIYGEQTNIQSADRKSPNNLHNFLHQDELVIQDQAADPNITASQDPKYLNKISEEQFEGQSSFEQKRINHIIKEENSKNKISSIRFSKKNIKNKQKLHIPMPKRASFENRSLNDFSDQATSKLSQMDLQSLTQNEGNQMRRLDLSGSMRNQTPIFDRKVEKDINYNYLPIPIQTRDLRHLKVLNEDLMNVTQSGTGSTNKNSYLVNKYCIPKPLKVSKKLEKEKSNGELLYLEQQREQRKDKFQKIQQDNLDKKERGLIGAKLKKERLERQLKKLRPLSSLCEAEQHNASTGNVQVMVTKQSIKIQDMSPLNIHSINNATIIIPVLDMLEKTGFQSRLKAQTPSFKFDVNHRNGPGQSSQSPLSMNRTGGPNYNQRPPLAKLIMQSLSPQKARRSTQRHSSTMSRRIDNNSKNNSKNTRQIQNKQQDSFSSSKNIHQQLKPKHSRDHVINFSNSKIRQKIARLIESKKGSIQYDNDDDFEEGDESILNSHMLSLQEKAQQSYMNRSAEEIIIKPEDELYIKFLKFKQAREVKREGYVTFKKEQPSSSNHQSGQTTIFGSQT
ncbi:UNKNOWN [Stylonychia lemnae]|uniref:Uncharacterized protein n=1 Tax=Stylonychia lemnae TaxID=5949 RepID=A0A077ZQR9_STYLE|nr:UNKNOWN [Stylonychia lemnae]|eukprot:CDW72247.1 UNKNOWN [Stylonychia lemnae]